MSSRLLSIAAVVTLFVAIASGQDSSSVPATASAVATTSVAAISSPVAGPSATATAPVTGTSPAAYPNNYPWSRAYPPLFDAAGAWAVPPTNTTDVATWVALLNQTGIPPAPIIKLNTAGDPINPYPAGQNPYCDWSIDGVCTRAEDVVKCPDKGVWGLTFDDGPTEFSPLLYDFLAKTNQKATLFLIGMQVAQNPLIAKAACDAGHEIAIHTWSHHALTSLTNEQIVAELKWTETIIKEVCGITPKFYRPPYGDFDDRVRYIAATLGYRAVIWDLDTNDWQIGEANSTTTTDTEDASFAKWIAGVSNDTAGHICLQHDLTNITVAEAIKNLPALQAAYKVMPVASCTNNNSPYRENILFPTINNTALPPNSKPINQSAIVSSSSKAPSSTVTVADSNATVAATPTVSVKPNAAPRSGIAPAAVALAAVAVFAHLIL